MLDRSERKLFAYQLQNQARLPGRDIPLAAANSSPAGTWSDGLNIWVADDSSNKLHAYNISDGTADSAKDFTTLHASGNNNPAGAWGDGETIWISDTGEQKLYAYKLPISDNADLRSITVGTTTIDNPDVTTRLFTREQISSVTVAARPQHPRAQANLSPPDADGNPGNGHQLEPGDNGANLTIKVTAQKGNIKIYNLTIILPAGPPAITGITPGDGYLTFQWNHPDRTGGVGTDEIFYYNLRFIESNATDKDNYDNWTKNNAIWYYLQDSTDNPAPQSPTG